MGAVCGTRMQYGQFRAGGRKIVAHRFAYELMVGPVPEGLELDHVMDRGCTSSLCVNPAHLEPVTHQVNCQRGTRATKEYCDNGHEFTEENTTIEKRGWRRCKQCHRDQERERRARAHAV